METGIGFPTAGTRKWSLPKTLENDGAGAGWELEGEEGLSVETADVLLPGFRSFGADGSWEGL